jgi:hypothetical protein
MPTRITQLGLLVLFGCSSVPPSTTLDAGGSECGPDGGTWAPCFSPDRSACHEREVPLATYCAYLQTCVPLDQWMCRGSTGIVLETIEEGCGYVSITYNGDVADEWGLVYDAGSGRVIYAWTNGRLSSGCEDAIRAGQKPSCASWRKRPCPGPPADSSGPPPSAAPQ